jgi:hypothetical protein
MGLVAQYRLKGTQQAFVLVALPVAILVDWDCSLVQLNQLPVACV